MMAPRKRVQRPITRALTLLAAAEEGEDALTLEPYRWLPVARYEELLSILREIEADDA